MMWAKTIEFYRSCLTQKKLKIYFFNLIIFLCFFTKMQILPEFNMQNAKKIHHFNLLDWWPLAISNQTQELNITNNKRNKSKMIFGGQM